MDILILQICIKKMAILYNIISDKRFQIRN